MIVLGIGSSIEPKLEYLKLAVGELNKNKNIKIIDISKVYLTEAWGGVAKNQFLNICVKIEYNKSPESLLNDIQKIELDLGRIRKNHWEDRVIDIDILIFNDLNISTDILTVPHKYILQRNFVYYPMYDVCGDILIKNKSLKSLIEENEEFIEVYLEKLMEIN